MSKKLALLIGCNYENTDNKLQGCINDIKIMRKYLITQANYDKNDIIVLRDDLEEFEQPTRENILLKLQYLVEQANIPANNITELFLHFSGHGNNDLVDKYSNLEITGEIDKKNEYIFSSDLNIVVDNEIRYILKDLSSNIPMYIVMDCCHSGTNIDLPYAYDIKNGKLRKIQDNSNKIIDYRDKKIYSISGCTDYQTSLDGGQYKPFDDPDDINFSILPNKRKGGLLTSKLIPLLNSGYTFFNCLARLRNDVRKYSNNTQEPLLNSSEQINVKQKK